MEIDERIRLIKTMGIFYHHSNQYLQNYMKKMDEEQLEDPILLFLIEKFQPVMQKQLAELMQVKPATISVHLKHLEQGGWIMRSVGEKDKRETYVTITDKGHDYIERVFHHFIKLAHEITAPLSDEEAKRMNTLTKKMILGLQESEEKNDA